MDTRYHNLLGWMAFAVVIGLSLSCASLGTSDGENGQAQPTGESEVSAVCSFPSDNFVNIAGNYAVSGGRTDQSGENYTGEATITQINQNCFSIEWHFDSRTRSGTIQMLGNIITGTWTEGDQSGILSGTASEDYLAIAWGVGTSEEHNTDYSEILTKK